MRFLRGVRPINGQERVTPKWVSINSIIHPRNCATVRELTVVRSVKAFPCFFWATKFRTSDSVLSTFFAPFLKNLINESQLTLNTPICTLLQNWNTVPYPAGLMTCLNAHLSYCTWLWPDIFALKHEITILGQWSNPVSGSRNSQAHSLWAKQHRV